MLAALVVAGCGGSTATADNGDPKPLPPMEVPTTLTDAKEAEVMVFKGGFGSDFYERVADDFMKANPGVKINLVADPQVWERVGPKVLAGNPPDLMYPGWKYDHWGLVAENQLMPLDGVLKEKAFGSDQTWGETFEPSMLKLGKYNGQQFVLPYFFSASGWWYSPSLFKEKGWSVPKTFKELLELAPKIKAAGIAPITYQGQYPFYMMAGFLEPWIIGHGGIEAYNAIQNLEPGAWKAEAPLKAAQMIVDLKNAGFFQEGAAALNHTEAQTQFITKKAAMIPCGTWLHSEMEKSIPAGFDMQFMLVPAVDGGKGDPSNIMVSIEPWMVPAKAKAQRVAVDYYKQLTSLENAKKFVVEKGTFMAIKGANDVQMPPYLQGAADAFKASKLVWAEQWRDWYRDYYSKVEANLTKLLSGEMTAEQFCEANEKLAEETRNNPDIIKHKAE